MDYTTDPHTDQTSDQTSEQTAIEKARAALRAQLASVREINRQKYRALLSMNAEIAPPGVIMARLETLLEMLLDDDARLGFDLGFENKMTEVLNQCLAEARQAHITGSRPNGARGNGGPPGLILP